MPDPIRPLSPQNRSTHANGAESEAEAMSLPPEPGKCEEPANRSVAPSAAAPPSPPAATSPEPVPSRRAVDQLVSRAPKRPLVPPDLPSDRTSARPFGPQAEAGTTRSGNHYADVAVGRGVTASGHTVEVLSASAQGGDHNELSVTGFRLQSQTRDGTVTATSDLFTAKAAVSTRMLPGCEGPYVAAGPTVAQVEFSHRLSQAEESSVALYSGGGFEAGLCLRDKDEDGQPETCVRVSVGPVVVTNCSEPSPPPPPDHDQGTGGGPALYPDQRGPSLGAGGAPGHR